MKTLRFALALTLAALVNCTEKGKPYIEHQADTRKSEPGSGTQVDPRDLPKAVSADVKILADRVLNEARIRDLRSYGSREVRDELLALNAQLTRTPNIAILKNYVSLLELECGDIKASCLGLKYFKLAGSSAEVAKIAAQLPEFEAKAARLLLFAVELKNGLTDNALLRLLIEKVPATNETVRSMLETSLMRSNENLRSAQDLREFLTGIHAWELAAGRRWMLSSSAQTALWSMLGRARLMYGADGRLSPEFTKVIEELNADAASLAVSQKALLAGKKLVPQALGAEAISKTDELYFLTDSVFLQRLAPQAAVDLFMTSGRKPEELLNAVDNYVRMRFAIGVAEANEQAKDIFSASVPTEQLLLHAMRQSGTVKRVWGTLNTRLAIVKVFAGAALKQSSASDLEARLRSIFNSYGRSVNLASVYPHTLLLFQMLSQKRFKISLRGWGEVDTGNLMPMIYYGTMPPLLHYSDEEAPLNHVEILHAFDMAVRSNLFATLDINQDNFVADVLSRLNQYPAIHITRTLDRIEKRFNETRHFTTFENICREFRGGRPVLREVDLKGLRQSSYFGGVMDVLFTGVSSAGSRSGTAGALSEQELGLFYADTEFSEAMERVRLDVAQYERVAAAMMTSLADYKRKYEGLSQESFEKTMPKTIQQLSAMKALRTRAMKLNTEWWERIGWCYTQAAVKDYETNTLIVRAEEAHLRSIYRDMKNLRVPEISEEEKSRIQTSHQFRGLPSNFVGLDRFDKDAYSMSSVDFLIRAGQTVVKISPNVRLNLGSRLDNDIEAVRNAEIRQILFTDTEDQFVESGLRAIFSRREPFATWQSLAGGRINIWQSVMKTMFTGYLLEMESGRATTFTPKKIMSTHEEMLRVTQLTQDDRALFKVLREESRFDPLYLNDRVLMYTIDLDKGKFALQDIWGLFDMPVIFSAYEKLGYDYDITHMGPEQIPASYRPKRYGYLELGRLYYTARSAWTRGNPIIPYNSALDHELDARVGKVVNDGIRSARYFQKEALAYVAEAAKRPVGERPRADITINQTITELLSPNLIPSYEADLGLFRQATQSCYVEKCADFK